MGTIGLLLAAGHAEAAPLALVGSTLDATVTVIDTATVPMATATIPLAGTPSGASITPPLGPALAEEKDLFCEYYEATKTPPGTPFQMGLPVSEDEKEAKRICDEAKQH